MSRTGAERRAASVGAPVTVADRHSYAEGRVPAPHGTPSSPGFTTAQRKAAATCQASQKLLEETLAKPGKFQLDSLVLSWRR